MRKIVRYYYINGHLRELAICNNRKINYIEKHIVTILIKQYRRIRFADYHLSGIFPDINSICDDHCTYHGICLIYRLYSYTVEYYINHYILKF